MQYRGHLLLPGESGPGLKVHLDVAEHHLAVESDGGGLGAWPLEVVDVERLHGDLFALNVAGEALRFVAEDTIAFAYTAVPAIESVGRTRGRAGLRSVFGWLKGSDKPAQSVALEAPPIDARPAQPVEEPARSEDSDDLIAVSDDLASTETWSEFVVDEAVATDQAATAPEQPAPDQMEPSTARCPAERSDGRRCESQILTDSGFCYPHDPRRTFEDGYQAAQDARAQLRKDATGRLNRIYARLDKAMRQVERGELDPEVAMAMAQLARTMCAILEMDEPSRNDT